MDYVIMIARSVTQAQRMLRLLEQCGIRAQIFRTPMGLTELGCSYAVKLRRDRLREALDCIGRVGLRPLSIYSDGPDGYREVFI